MIIFLKFNKISLRKKTYIYANLTKVNNKLKSFHDFCHISKNLANIPYINLEDAKKYLLQRDFLKNLTFLYLNLKKSS